MESLKENLIEGNLINGRVKKMENFIRVQYLILSHCSSLISIAMCIIILKITLFQ